MSASIARFLKDFGEPEAPAMLPAPSFELDAPSFDDFPQMVEEPVLDIDAIKAAAIEAGREAARSELIASFEADKLAMIDAHDAAMIAERERFQAEVAEQLAQNLKYGLEQMASLFTAQAMQVLAPVLTEELSRKASADLAAVVKDAMLDGECSKLIIKGPKPMFEAFNAVMGLTDDQFQFSETDNPDLSVEVSESVVVTRMSAWATSLRKVMQ
jgi:hypothetical protein